MMPERCSVSNNFVIWLRSWKEASGRLSQVACDGDEALRSDVESLLSHKSEAKKFIEAPVLEGESQR